MERLLNNELLGYLNNKRQVGVAPIIGPLNVRIEEIEDIAVFDVVDTRHKGLPVVRAFGEGHATYFNDSHTFKLKIIQYEDFLNALGDVSKHIKRPDLMLYTSELKSYFIIHEISIGSSRNKRKDGKHQLGNTIQLFNRIPAIKQYLSTFTNRLCILSGADGAVVTPNGIADAFSEIYHQIADPEPLNCAFCQKGGFDAFITHNIVLR